MKSKFLVVYLIVLCICSILNAEQEKEHIPSHYLMTMCGKNQLYYDCVRPHKTISVGYNPFPFTKGFGLNTWYLREDYTSMYGQKPSIIIIQPSTRLLHKFFILKLGINVIYISEGEEPGLGSWLPAIEIKYEFMKNFYLSAGYGSDMFFGSVNANIHYLLNDNISGIMLGYAYKENWEDDYNGLAYKLDCMIFEKFLLRVCGNIDFEFKSKGIQAGIGMLL